MIDRINMFKLQNTNRNIVFKCLSNPFYMPYRRKKINETKNLMFMRYFKEIKLYEYLIRNLFPVSLPFLLYFGFFECILIVW